MANISFSNQRLLDKLFVRSGYVLDFTNAMFADFFESEVGVDIYNPRYEANGTSKGNRLRTFLKIDDAPTVARALRALWEYRCDTIGTAEDESDFEPRVMKLIHELSPFDVSQTAAPSPVGATSPPVELQTTTGEPAFAAITALASYAHQDAAYDARVLRQVNRLRGDGIDCWSDHFETFPREGWPRWMERQLTERRWILVFASESYRRRADGSEQPGRGLGVIWEHGFIRSELYEKGKINERFLPVGFGPSERAYVPRDLRDYTYFDLGSEEDYQKLLSVLRGKPLVTPHPLGGISSMAALSTPAVAADVVAQNARESDEANSEEKPLRSQSSTVFFSDRFSQAFPGVRGISWFKQPVAIERLSLLLKRPLTYRSRGGGEYEPIWFWGRGDLGISHFSVEPGHVLMDVSELIIDEIAAVNLGSYSHKFVYVKTSPAEPTGLYDQSNIEEWAARFGYVSEEFGMHDGRFITRAEYDDGAAVIDGRPVDVRGSVKLRVRFLTPYNFIIAAHNSPVNSQQFDTFGERMLNEILRGEKTLDDLATAVLRLPKRSPMSYEFG